MITAEMLKQMYQYKDHNAFARQLIEMAIDPVVAEREYVELPSEDEYSDYLTEILEVIYEDVSGDEVVMAMKETAENAVPMPNLPEMDVMWTVASGLLTDVNMAGNDVAESAEKAQKEALQLIESMK